MPSIKNVQDKEGILGEEEEEKEEEGRETKTVTC